MGAVHRWVSCAAVLFLAGCFHPSYDHTLCGPHGECPSGLFCSAGLTCERGMMANSPDGGTTSPDGAPVDLSPICPSIALGNPQFNAAACATPTSSLLQITADTSFDSDLGTSNAAGLTCARVHNTGASVGDICVLAAASIVVQSGVVLSAHGTLPFALFAQSITIQGTVDVASHLGGQVGAGSTTTGCARGSLPTGGGGGRGGDAAERGGPGGDDGSNIMTGATGGGSFSFNDITGGGCGGTRGGTGGAVGVPGSDGGNATGGTGGGAVWIVSLSSDLIIDAGAKINASGASGIGGQHEGEGGAGGGAGGLILLQAPRIRLDPSAAIFANGGHGGGGTGSNMGLSGFTFGTDGTDPVGAMSGGDGGAGGLDGGLGTGMPGGGDGGPGFPFTARDGLRGTTDAHGGGGGGGGPGAIRVVSATDIAGPNVSPPPVVLK